MSLFFLFVLLVLAIDNITDIVSTVDLLAPAREWFKAKFPKFGKIAECRYCQSLWLSAIATGFCPVAYPALSHYFGDTAVIWLIGWLASWFATHRTIQFTREFMDRYLNRAPLNVFLQAEEPVPPTEDTAPESVT